MRCPICNKVFSEITYTHVRSHGMTPEEYRKKYNSKLGKYKDYSPSQNVKVYVIRERS